MQFVIHLGFGCTGLSSCSSQLSCYFYSWSFPSTFSSCCASFRFDALNGPHYIFSRHNDLEPFGRLQIRSLLVAETLEWLPVLKALSILIILCTMLLHNQKIYYGSPSWIYLKSSISPNKFWHMDTFGERLYLRVSVRAGILDMNWRTVMCLLHKFHNFKHNDMLMQHVSVKKMVILVLFVVIMLRWRSFLLFGKLFFLTRVIKTELRNNRNLIKGASTVLQTG